MTHVKKTQQANPGLQFKEVLQLAGRSYKKQQQGGGSGKSPMGHNDALTHSESVNGGEPTEAMGGKEPVATLALENTEHVGNELTGGRRRRRKSTKKAKKAKGKKGGKKKMTKKKGKKSRRSRRRH